MEAPLKERRMTHPNGLPQMPGLPRELEGAEQAMLALSYGVHVIGSQSKSGELNAMLADWVMQVSFKPRLVTVAIENDARTLRFIRETGGFVVNLLHEKDGDEIARKVVMPSEAKKIRGRPVEMQSSWSISSPASTTSSTTTAPPSSSNRSRGSRATRSNSSPPATTRS
jgi:flavin reductase (DIM6/NTAB) family NADH-FMN oxidoreductase RutF